MRTATLNHPTYKYVEKEAEADAVAWVFTDHDNMVKYPFKFPEIKPNELRANILYSGLCHTDSSWVREEWFSVNQYPICPGHEIIGVVSALGSDVKGFKIGDQVGLGPFRDCCRQCDYCKKGYDNLCTGEATGLVDQRWTYGDKYWGGYSTAVQHPADFFVKIPSSLALEKAAPLLCAGVTMYTPISKYAKPGDDVAVLGVGGLGHVAVMIAKAWGCKVTGFTIFKDQVGMIKSLGADEVVVVDKELNAIKQKKGKYHLVLNTIFSNDEKFSDYIRMTRPLGTFCQLGLPEVCQSSPICVSDIVFNQITFVGSLVGSRKEREEMLEFCAKHNILPMCETFEFEEFPKAYEKLLHGGPKFRCVVRCKDSFRGGPKV